MIKLYITSINELKKKEDLDFENELLSLCDEKRKKETPQYRQQEDRVRSIVAGLLLQYAYLEYRKSHDFSIQHPNIVYGEDGKPFVEGEDTFYFSISHAKEYVILASASKEIGVDIEQIVTNKNIEKLTKRFFHTIEKEELRHCKTEADQKKFFTNIWTVKESYLKFLGIGLRYGMDSFYLKNEQIVDEKQQQKGKKIFVKTIDSIENYFISICSNLEQEEIKMDHIALEELIFVLKKYFL